MNQGVATCTFDKEGSILSGLVNGILIKFIDAWAMLYGKQRSGCEILIAVKLFKFV